MPKRGFSLQGLRETQALIRAEINRLGVASELGITRAALLVRRRSQQLVPVEFGHLKASAEHRVIRQVQGPTAVVGYTADYAVYVHEIPPPELGAPHPDQHVPGTRTARHGVGGWKYLEKALFVSQDDIIQALRMAVRPRDHRGRFLRTGDSVADDD